MDEKIKLNEEFNRVVINSNIEDKYTRKILEKINEHDDDFFWAHVFLAFLPILRVAPDGEQYADIVRDMINKRLASYTNKQLSKREYLALFHSAQNISAVIDDALVLARKMICR